MTDTVVVTETGDILAVADATVSVVEVVAQGPQGPKGVDGDVPPTRTISAGTGLTGGGDLSANRTMSFDTGWGDARYVATAGDTMTGDLTFSGTARRILGDLSNATVGNRLAIQNSATNAGGNLSILPNGTGDGAGVNAFETSDPANSAYLQFSMSSALGGMIRAGALGSGTQRALSFEVNGATRMSIAAAGNVTIAAPASGTALAVNGAAGAGGIRVNNAVGTSAISTSDGTCETYIHTNAGFGSVWGNASNHRLAIRTNNTERFALEAGGDAVFAHATSGAGAWYDGNNSSKRAYLGMDLGSTTVFRLYSAAVATNIATWNLTNGDFVATGSVTAYSDERLKKDWAPLGTDFIDRLAGVRHGTYTRTDTNSRQVGVSAQSLANVLPEAVKTASNEDGTLSVAYGNAALAACVELAKEVVALRKRISDLEAR